MTSGSARPHCVLVGPPGAGKTAVGRELAARAGLGFRDTDLDVEHSTGLTIADLFVDRGEAYFRSMEEAAVALALREHSGVLSLGGGAVLSEATRARLAGHRVVHLEISLSHALARTGMTGSRPLLLGNPRARLKQMLDERRPLYLAVATCSVGTDDQDVAGVVADVERALQRYPLAHVAARVQGQGREPDVPSGDPGPDQPVRGEHQ